MKFFAVFFTAITLLCAIFWIVDGPGSGMAWPTAICAVLGIGGVIGDRLRSKSLNDKAGR